MSTIYSQFKPGTALKVMIEEHMYIQEFTAMIKRK